MARADFEGSDSIFRVGGLRILAEDIIRNELHGYTVHQQYPTLYFPINAHNVKK